MLSPRIPLYIVMYYIGWLYFPLALVWSLRLRASVTVAPGRAICSRHHHGCWNLKWTNSSAASHEAGALSEELLGQADPEGGSFFAREAAAVWLLRAGRVFRWDGRHSSPMGTPGQAIASLCLEWSQR